MHEKKQFKIITCHITGKFCVCSLSAVFCELGKSTEIKVADVDLLSSNSFRTVSSFRKNPYLGLPIPTEDLIGVR